MTKSIERNALPILIVLGLLIYAGTFDVPFIYDDLTAIVPNRRITDLGSSWSHLFSGRGISLFTFALNYALTGFSLWSWHLVNLAIHLGATTLVYLLLRKLFAGGGLAPLVGAAFFLAHPLQTQAVTYLVQRMASLSAFFVLLSVYAFLVARQMRRQDGTFFSRGHLCWYSASLLAGLAAVLAKENGAIFPLLLLLTAWLADQESFNLKRELTYLTPLWCGAALVALYLIFTNDVINQSIVHLEIFTSRSQMRTELPSEITNVRWKYLATQCAVIWIYFKLLVLPWGQRLDYSYPLAMSFFELRVLAGLASLALLILLTALSRNRYLLFALLWVLVALSIESSIFPLEPVFEHRMYLPMFGVAMAVAELWRRYLPSRFRGGLAIVVIGLLSLLTIARNQVWRDPVVFWEDNLAKVPYSFRVKFLLSEALVRAGREEESVHLLEKVFADEPSPAMISSKQYQNTIFELGKAQIRFKRFVGAVETFRKAIRHYPQNAMAYLYLGAAYAELGEKELSQRFLTRASQLDPKNPIIIETLEYYAKE